MSDGIEELQILRLLRAFQQITDPDARRLVLMFVQQQLEKQQAGEKPGRTEH